MCVTLYVQLYVPTPPNPPRGRSDYLEPVATSVLLSLSLSLSLSSLSGECGSQIVKRFIFIFRPWPMFQGRKIKKLLFSLTRYVPDALWAALCDPPPPQSPPLKF